jgi:hypothetical protein
VLSMPSLKPLPGVPGRGDHFGNGIARPGGIMANMISIPGFADPFSSLSHLFGALLFSIFSVFLLRRGRGDALRMASLLLFCAGTVFLLSTSGVMHLLGKNGTAHSVMRRVDHAAIFVLIACSFTPIHVILFRGWRRWTVLILVWTIAIRDLYRHGLDRTCVLACGNEAAWLSIRPADHVGRFRIHHWRCARQRALAGAGKRCAPMA